MENENRKVKLYWVTPKNYYEKNQIALNKLLIQLRREDLGGTKKIHLIKK
jgi:hypothetical protein